VSGWQELANLAVGDKLLFPAPIVTDENVALDFLRETRSRPQGGGTKQIGPKSVRPSYSLGRILGLYLAEGVIINNPTGPSGVTFAVHGREVARTEKWLMEHKPLFRSLRVASRPDSKTVTVTAYGGSFAAFVERLCG